MWMYNSFDYIYNIATLIWLTDLLFSIDGDQLRSAMPRL